MRQLTRRQMLAVTMAVSFSAQAISVPRTFAQGNIPNGVFVRETNGRVWLILNGQRVAVPIWPTNDNDIAALLQSGRYAVMNDSGSIVAGERPSWYSEGASQAPMSPPAGPAPSSTGASALPSTSAALVVTQTATWVEKMFQSTYVVGMIENQSSTDLSIKTIAVSLLGSSGETVGGANALDRPTGLP
jgi:hypothetical protein